MKVSMYVCAIVYWFLRHRKKTRIIYLKTKPVFERDVIPANQVLPRLMTYGEMLDPKSCFISYTANCLKVHKNFLSLKFTPCIPTTNYYRSCEIVQWNKWIEKVYWQVYVTYPVDFLERRNRWLLDLLQITPVGIAIVSLPLGVLAFLQHGTEIHATRIWHIQLTFSLIFAMNVRHNNTESSLIVGLNFTDAQNDWVCGTVGDELVATTFNDFTDTLVEFKCRGGVALDLNCDVTSSIWSYVNKLASDMRTIFWNHKAVFC